MHIFLFIASTLSDFMEINKALINCQLQSTPKQSSRCYKIICYLLVLQYFKHYQMLMVLQCASFASWIFTHELLQKSMNVLLFICWTELKKFGASLYRALYVHQTSFWGVRNIVFENLCGNHSVKKPFGNLIFNLILASWKIIGYSKKEQIEDLNIFCYISLFSPEG